MILIKIVSHNFFSMKVNILKPAALAVMVLLAACTKEIVESPGNNDLNLGQGEDVIRISLSNTTATRAARPIGSSEALNNINRIAFKFLKNGTTENGDIKLEAVIDGEGVTISDYEVVEGNILKLPASYKGTEINVKFSGMTEGAYRIIAYGYNYTGGSDASDAFPYETMALAGESNKYYYQVSGVTKVQEIFAGCNNGEFVGVNQFGKFQSVPEIVLTRQVAGLMAYFKNAPVFVNNTKVAKVTVSSRANVTGFSFPASLVSDPTHNGYSSDNSWYGSTWVNYLTFDMKKASNYNDEHLDSGDLYKFGDNYLLSEENDEVPGLKCDKNTLFGSRFMLAYPSHADFNTGAPKCATLNICYWDADGNLILSVPLRKGGDEKPLDSSEEYQYNILCNNFYSIGKKTDVEGEDDNDNPIDIQETTGYDYAKVSISLDWSAVHDLFN